MKTNENEEKITCIETENEEIIFCDDIPCAARRRETLAEFYKRINNPQAEYYKRTNNLHLIAAPSRSSLRRPENK